MADGCAKRLQKELTLLRRNPMPCFSAGPVDESNLYKWQAVMQGPETTPYAGGHFVLDIEFTQEFPMVAPRLQFKTKIFHCNINPERGNICLDILSGRWTPALTIDKLLMSISALLEDPNPDSPLNGEAARLYKNDRSQHDAKVREWTRSYAQ